MNQKAVLRWFWALVVCLAAYGAPLNSKATESAVLSEILDRPLTATEVQELELVTRLHTTISVMYRQAVADGESQQARTGQVPDADHWRSLIRHIGARVIENFRPIAPPQNRYQLYLGWLKHLSLSHISRALYQIARTQGVPAASAIAFGAFMDFGAPAFLALIGHPELAPLTWLVPFEVPGYTLGYALQRQFVKRRLTEAYGGEEAYRKFRQPYLDNLEALHLDGIEDLLIPLTNKVRESNGAVIADESGFFERLMTRLGITTQRMNYQNLARFCRRRGLAEPVLRALEAHDELPGQLKAVLLLHYLDEKNDPQVMSDLATTFSRSFVSLTARPDMEALTPWIREFAHARTLADVHRLLREVPPDIPAALVAQLWQETILPVVIQNNESITLRESMRLKKGFYALLARATSQPDAPWTSEWSQAFVAYTRAVFPDDRFPGTEPQTSPRSTPPYRCQQGWAAMAGRR